MDTSLCLSPTSFRDGMARGWKTLNGAQLDHDLILDADVAIIGSGAGGGTTAEILSAAGLKVLLIEEGPLKTSSDFKMLEDEAYASLYQEGIGRMSKDGAVSILQGRAVGGTTLVNWTSSFRTPAPTLEQWAREHAVVGHSSEQMAPWFERMEQRLGVAPWRVPPNANNRGAPQTGCEQFELQLARDPAQRARVLEPRLLRHGLPDQRQAVDAGDDHSRHPRKRRRIAVSGPRPPPVD
jgi:choline dehydrogenase-like flavoprotein